MWEDVHYFALVLDVVIRILLTVAGKSFLPPERSDNKHAVCVFTGGKSIGDDDQLLSGMNTNLHLVLDVVKILLTVAGKSFLPPEAL